jgi:hypothetical protein
MNVEQLLYCRVRLAEPVSASLLAGASRHSDRLGTAALELLTREEDCLV